MFRTRCNEVGSADLITWRKVEPSAAYDRRLCLPVRLTVEIQIKEELNGFFRPGNG